MSKGRKLWWELTRREETGLAGEEGVTGAQLLSG